MMKLSDWQQAIRTSNPTSYRIGNSTLRFQTKFIILLVTLALIGLIYIALPTYSSYDSEVTSSNSVILRSQTQFKTESSGWGGKKHSILWAAKDDPNSNYPFTKPVTTEKGLKYRIGIISDLDTESKSQTGKWISYLRKGSLYVQYNKVDPISSKVAVEWESSEPQIIKSGLNEDGRGMELSELVYFNNQLYTCDDRTGIVYSINVNADTEEIAPVPWVILADGNGTIPKGFKCEWGCVKDNSLWVGGLGKEWTTSTGELINHNPQFVKRITKYGEVTHWDWKSNYNKMAQALNIHFPGYVIHESAGWSNLHNKWVFLPRRASKDQYNDRIDEKKGTNIILLSDENFENIEARHVGEVIPTHGFSSFKFIPGTKDELIIALKSEEIDGKTATYVLIFTINGHILLPETKVGDHKYEGIEFL